MFLYIFNLPMKYKPVQKTGAFLYMYKSRAVFHQNLSLFIKSFSV